MSEINPANTVLVVKNKDGREVGRIAATAPNANAYLQEMASFYKEMTVDYIEDKDAAMISRMLAPR